MNKKTVFSAIQPTNTPHLGNYLGALKNWVALQDTHDCVYAIADLHAITVRQDPARLRAQIRDVYAILLAIGIDPNRSAFLVQNHNPHHAELAWLLSCFTQFGELSRMTQFKDKTANVNEAGVNVGLFTYPVLQAADILLYQADCVPVGADQKQHLELSRDVAVRFNNAYSPTFTPPEPLIPTNAARVMSLSDPTKKMSKSDENPNASVGILDDTDTIIRKFKRAVTDSGAEIIYDEGNPEKAGVNNLLSIYSAVTGKSISDCEREFAGSGYGAFKLAVGEAVASVLAPIRGEYKRIVADKTYLDSCMREGCEKAMSLSVKTLRKVYKKMGLR